jgi:hypothetical protein
MIVAAKASHWEDQSFLVRSQLFFPELDSVPNSVATFQNHIRSADTRSQLFFNWKIQGSVSCRQTFPWDLSCGILEQHMHISAVCSLGKRKKESGGMDLEALSTPPNRYTYIETQGTKLAKDTVLICQMDSRSTTVGTSALIEDPSQSRDRSTKLPKVSSVMKTCFKQRRTDVEQEREILLLA